MILYPYILFFHIVGVIGLFSSNLLELIAVFRMRGAQSTAQIQEWMSLNRLLEKVVPISAVLILVSGLYMVFTVWGWSHAWIILSLSLMVLLGILGPVINGPRMKAIHVALTQAPAGAVSTALREHAADPVLQVYALIPSFLSLGAVALMVLKLDWPGSIAVMVMAFALSILIGLLARKTPRETQPAVKEI
jgi:uncharacterized membrane protein